MTRYIVTLEVRVDPEFASIEYFKKEVEMFNRSNSPYINAEILEVKERKGKKCSLIG